MRVFITGAGGQLASAFVATFSSTDADMLALSHGELDITDTDAVMERVAAFKPGVIINCAAYNDVDRAQLDGVKAFDVNAFGVRALSRAAAATGASFVHYSSDFVFDGRASRPYSEADHPNPQSIYAMSKLVGEWFARDASRAFVLRVESLFGGPVAKSSVDRIVDAIRNGRDARAFTDRTVSPSYVVDVVAATQALIERGRPGLYHCVSSGCCTWYELATEIAGLLGRPTSAVVPISIHDVELAAPRPQFAALSNENLKQAGIVMPSWQDALRRHVSRVHLLRM